jgi:hypothetical protein
MTDIPSKKSFEALRGHATRTSPWSDIAERWRRVPSFAPMLRLVESVASSPASSQVFPSTSMFELLVSDSPDFRIGDSTLHVVYRPSDGMFEFHHHSFSGHDDEKTCFEQEALETFWLFVKIKFGVLYEKPVAS